MAENKKSFVLYADLISIVEKLVIKDRENKTNYSGELFFHVLQYVNDREPIPIDFIIEMAFEPIKLQLKRDLQKYEVTKEKRSLAGKKSAEIKQQNSTKSTSVESVQQPSTNSTVSDNVNENVNDNDILLEKETKEILSDEGSESDLVNPEIKEAKKVAPKKINEILHIPEDFISLWNDWTEYRKLRKFKAYASPKYEQMAVDKLLELSGCDPIIASKILQNTFTNNYQGFFPLKENQNGNSNTGQSNSNGNGYSAGSNQFGKGGKITASQMVTRARQEAAAGHSESGNRTSDVEILT